MSNAYVVPTAGVDQAVEQVLDSEIAERLLAGMSESQGKGAFIMSSGSLPDLSVGGMGAGGFVSAPAPDAAAPEWLRPSADVAAASAAGGPGNGGSVGMGAAPMGSLYMLPSAYGATGAGDSEPVPPLVEHPTPIQPMKIPDSPVASTATRPMSTRAASRRASAAVILAAAAAAADSTSSSGGGSHLGDDGYDDVDMQSDSYIEDGMVPDDDSDDDYMDYESSVPRSSRSARHHKQTKRHSTGAAAGHATGGGLTLSTIGASASRSGPLGGRGWRQKERAELERLVRAQCHDLLAQRASVVAPPEALSLDALDSLQDEVDWDAVARGLASVRSADACRTQWAHMLAAERQAATGGGAGGAHAGGGAGAGAGFSSADDAHGGPFGDGSGRGKWSKEEDRRLVEAIREYGDSHWKMVANFVGTRTAAQCLHRWKHSLKPSISRQKWTAAEDERLMRAVAQHGRHWSLIAHVMGNRTGAQCRERFCNKLDPEIYRGTWTAEEDAHLREAVQQVGVGKWAQIAKMLHPPRTDYQIRKRWYIISRDPATAPPHKGHHAHHSHHAQQQQQQQQVVPRASGAGSAAAAAPAVVPETPTGDSGGGSGRFALSTIH